MLPDSVTKTIDKLSWSVSSREKWLQLARYEQDDAYLALLLIALQDLRALDLELGSNS